MTLLQIAARLGPVPRATANRLALAPKGVSRSTGDAPADLTPAGAAADLYLALWNRGHDSAITVLGDPEQLGIWHDNARIRWG